MADRFHRADDAAFAKRVTGLRGTVEVMYSWALSFPRTLAGTGKPLNPYTPSLLGMGPVLEFWGLRFFLFMRQGFSHSSAAPCHSYHLAGVSLCQRIRTSIKLRSK